MTSAAFLASLTRSSSSITANRGVPNRSFPRPSIPGSRTLLSVAVSAASGGGGNAAIAAHGSHAGLEACYAGIAQSAIKDCGPWPVPAPVVLRLISRPCTIYRECRRVSARCWRAARAGRWRRPPRPRSYIPCRKPAGNRDALRAPPRSPRSYIASRG